MTEQETALIVGSGRGLSASLARLFAAEGMRVVLAARNVDKLAPLLKETGGRAYACDASDPAAVAALFRNTAADVAAPDVVVYNASNRGGRGPIEELDPDAIRQAILVTCYGGFLVGQAAARQMIPPFGTRTSSFNHCSLIRVVRRAPFSTLTLNNDSAHSSPMKLSMSCWLFFPFPVYALSTVSPTITSLSSLPLYWQMPTASVPSLRFRQRLLAM